MLTYIVRRTGIALITLALITFIIYGLIRNMPGSPVTQELSRECKYIPTINQFQFLLA